MRNTNVFDPNRHFDNAVDDAVNARSGAGAGPQVRRIDGEAYPDPAEPRWWEKANPRHASRTDAVEHFDDGMSLEQLIARSATARRNMIGRLVSHSDQVSTTGLSAAEALKVMKEQLAELSAK